MLSVPEGVLAIISSLEVYPVD